jgi:hypothetical protein
MSSTKINFKALDSLSIKPMGIYGSKEAIAELLFSIGAVSRETSVGTLSTNMLINLSSFSTEFEPSHRQAGTCLNPF